MTPLLRGAAARGAGGRRDSESSGSSHAEDSGDHREKDGGDVVRRSLDAAPGAAALSLLGGAAGGLRSRGMRSVDPTWWGFAEATKYLAAQGTAEDQEEPLSPKATKRRLSE